LANLSVGIIGLPNAGKSTLFNALTHTKVQVASFPFTTVSPNVGMASVPDDRLDKLARLINPQKVTPAAVEFVDVAGLVRGAHKGEGLGNEFLSRIRGMDVLVEVVRCFQRDEVAHPEGKVDPVSDIQIIELELILSDLEMLQRKLTKLHKLVKSTPKENEDRLILLQRAKEHLEEAKSLSKVLSEEESHKLKEEDFLTTKPLVYVANVGEDDLTSPSPLLKQLRQYLLREGEEGIEICAELEEELGDLLPEEKEEFLRELGIKEEGLTRLLKRTYPLLNLITFFTITGGQEVRAWPFQKGGMSHKAAGKVHSDMERGFIRAEVIPAKELLEIGSFKVAKEEGKMRTEGKKYRVEDGDVIHFIFSE